MLPELHALPRILPSHVFLLSGLCSYALKQLLLQISARIQNVIVQELESVFRLLLPFLAGVHRFVDRLSPTGRRQWGCWSEMFSRVEKVKVSVSSFSPAQNKI